LVKNQYYGDINDYKKYAILRYLVGDGAYRLGVNWYLTDDDGSSDGRILGYLCDPAQWRYLDQELFDRLKESVVIKGLKSVSEAHAAMGVDGVVYFNQSTPDGGTQRDKWFKEALEQLKSCDLAFLDPDNGLNVKSCAYGWKRSSKYVFDHELKAMWDERPGRSLIIYQHFGRVKRDLFLDECSLRLNRILGCPTVIRLQCSHIVFFLVPCAEHLSDLWQRAMNFALRWGKNGVACTEWSADSVGVRATLR
jgi:hypothetical protein